MLGHGGPTRSHRLHSHGQVGAVLVAPFVTVCVFAETCVVLVCEVGCSRLSSCCVSVTPSARTGSVAPRRFGRTVSDIAGLIGPRAAFVYDACGGTPLPPPGPHSHTGSPTLQSITDTLLRIGAADALGWSPLNVSALMGAGVDIVRILTSAAATVPEEDGGAFTADSFDREYRCVGRPVVVRGALPLGGAIRKLVSKSALVSRYGDDAVVPASAPYARLYGVATPKSTLREYVRAHMAGSSASPTSPPPAYVFDSRFLHVHPEVLETAAFPSYTEAEYGYHTLRQFALGPAMSGAPPHFHPSAWNGVLAGAKLWWLFPPELATFEGDVPVWEWWRAHADADGHIPGAIVAVQGPGDAVYVPSDWGHAVLNLADTVAVAVEAFG